LRNTDSAEALTQALRGFHIFLRALAWREGRRFPDDRPKWSGVLVWLGLH